MNILVTAGNTLVPIDRVRAITNIFTGRTGTLIAREARRRGHAVTLLTSHPEMATEIFERPPSDRWSLRSYRTFAELQKTMEEEINNGGKDAVIHSAAVSDYQASGIYAPVPGTRFDSASGRWQSSPSGTAALQDRTAGKVKSDELELWLRLTRTPKLIDFIRRQWNFRRILVKFKLEVGIDEELLRQIAEESRQASEADLMVANTLEGARSWALIGPIDGTYQKIARPELSQRLISEVERLHEERSRG